MQNLNRKINEKSLNNEAVSSSSLESSKDLFTQSVEKGIEGADQKEPSSLPPFIPETFDITPIWKSELLLTFAHIFLIRGSLCVLRALQRDSHLPVNPAYAARNQPDYQTVRDSLVELVNLADPVEEYTRRLGVLVNQPYSPLVELDFDSEANYGGTRSGGSAALFARSHAYLTGPQFTEEPTEQLYANAAHLFETAHLRLLQADQHDQLQQEHLISWEASTTQPWAGRLGPPDSPILLKSLAKHNAIACRILAARPDRRPRPMERMTLATEGVVFASKEQPSEVSPLPEDNGASSSYNASTRTSLSLNTCIPKSSEPAVSCKRPLIHYYPTHHSQQQHHLGLRCRPYLPPNCPVEMVFTFLPSRMYPLIRLLTTCSESKT
ncbi:unnamed protein product [Protopolystoma xenopodis]|uniref:Uncharacterized protein n=1 Tax=Protopolystoma xenopodis TaxID=117903 RepID=A0A3S5B1C5_9PLAT|nr:unnamed protein product [Protopolystoma xenopodis]